MAVGLEAVQDVVLYLQVPGGPVQLVHLVCGKDYSKPYEGLRDEHVNATEQGNLDMRKANYLKPASANGKRPDKPSSPKANQ